MTNRHQSTRTALALAATVAALAASLGATPQRDELRTPAVQNSEGAREGIKVHGDWVIDVRDESGRIVNHYAFKNGLAGGHVPLTYLISRQRPIGSWGIWLAHDGISGPCGPRPGVPSLCQLYERFIGYPQGDSVRNDLALVADPNGTSMSLRGSIRALAGGQISEVKTYVLVCGAHVSAAECATASEGVIVPFSSRTLPQPIPIQPGQTIDVVVSFSFS